MRNSRAEKNSKGFLFQIIPTYTDIT